jgi:Xylose isomerase-like TIM barrel.
MPKVYTLAAFADEASASIDGQIKAMNENGITHLEIRGVDGQNISEITVAKAKDIKTALGTHSLKVWSIGSPTGKIDIEDDFAAHFDSFKHMVEIAHELDCKHFRLFSFFGVDTPTKRDEAFARLQKFIEYTKRNSLWLCHENEKGVYGDTAEKCLEIHKNLPGLKAVFDPANFVQCGEDTVKAWKLLSPYVEYMHIKDSMPDGTVVPAGKGVGNLPYLLSQYKGKVLTLEPHLAFFAGLDKLVGDEKSKVGSYAYASNEQAFKAAADALKELICG